MAEAEAEAEAKANAGPKVLMGMHLLQDLSPEELVALEQVCRFRRFAGGEQIFDREAVTRDIYFVVRGRVRVVNYSLSRREIALDEISEGGGTSASLPPSTVGPARPGSSPSPTASSSPCRPNISWPPWRSTRRWRCG